MYDARLTPAAHEILGTAWCGLRSGEDFVFTSWVYVWLQPQHLGDLEDSSGSLDNFQSLIRWVF